MNGSGTLAVAPSACPGRLLFVGDPGVDLRQHCVESAPISSCARCTINHAACGMTGFAGRNHASA
jgi:hypothetical protein